MSWKRLRRWLLRALLVCLAGLLCAAGIVWYWIWEDHRHIPYPSEEKIIATALGWSASGTDESIGAEIMRQQPLALSLLGNSDPAVRLAAERFFRWRRQKLDAAALDAVAAELMDPYGVARETMLVLLATAGDAGLRRIGAIYRSGDPIEPTLHQLISEQMNNREVEKELTALLTTIVTDSDVCAPSRHRAAEALGHIRLPLEPQLPENQQRTAEINAVRDLAQTLPEPIAAALRSTAKRTDDEQASRIEWARADARRHAQEYYGQEFWTLSADGHEAIAALADPDDWRRVGEAANALARNSVKAALPELERVAAKHWYAPVRKTAEWATRVIQGQEPYCELDHEGRPKAPPHDLNWILDAEFEQWRRNPPQLSMPAMFRELLRPAREACLKRLSPRIDEVEYRRPSRLPQRRPLRTLGQSMDPKCRIAFAGGTLLGYDSGEFGAGTVFYRKGSVPLFFRTANVAEFVRMPFGVLVMDSFPAYSDSPGPEIVSSTPDGTVSVTRFKKRLPAGWGRYRKLPNGDLLLPCIGIDVVITSAGELRGAGSDKEVGAP